MARFNMMDLLNNSSKEVEDRKEMKSIFETKQISIKELIPSEENFYSTKYDEIKNLKDSIEMFGVQQNLIVKKIGDNKYKIITGHRRYLALKSLVDEGKNEFEYAPCKVEIEDDSIKNKLLLIITNSTARQLTDWEKTQQAQELKKLLVEYKRKEKLPGRIREIIADILNTSKTQIARMESISKNLTEDLKEEFKEDRVNISTAYEASKLSKDIQMDLLDEYKNKGNLTIKDVKTKANSSEKLVEHNKNIVEQRVPSYIYKNIFTVIKEMDIDKMADFICSKCNGGNGCAGFCDLAIQCTEKNKHETCIKWLKTQTII